MADIQPSAGNIPLRFWSVSLLASRSCWCICAWDGCSCW